jgi:hypothetical protein
VLAVMRLVSRAVHPLLVCLLLAVAVHAAPPCCPVTIMPSEPVLSVLVPDYAAERWYACRGVAEEDLGITIALNVMPTEVAWSEPASYPIDVMRAVLDEMIREDDLPDMAMLPHELAREISDRCYVYDLDLYACYIQWPFLYEGVDGVILPWESGLAVVFFEPGRHVELGLALLSHPVIGALLPPEGCCVWPPEPEEPECVYCPCVPCAP